MRRGEGEKKHPSQSVRTYYVADGVWLLDFQIVNDVIVV